MATCSVDWKSLKGFLSSDKSCKNIWSTEKWCNNSIHQMTKVPKTFDLEKKNDFQYKINGWNFSSTGKDDFWATGIWSNGYFPKG